MNPVSGRLGLRGQQKSGRSDTRWCRSGTQMRASPPPPLPLPTQEAERIFRDFEAKYVAQYGTQLARITPGEC